MPMLIRPYRINDFQQVCRLLSICGVETPREKSDFDGLCYVAEDKKEVVGVIWVLVGMSTQAYVDYFAVRKDYRGKGIWLALLKAAENTMKQMGVKRYNFFVEKKNEKFLRVIEKVKTFYGIERLRDLQPFRRHLT